MSSKKIKLVCCKTSFLGKLHNLVILPRFLGVPFYINSGLKQDIFLVSSPTMFFMKMSDFIISKQLGPIHKKKDSKKGKRRGSK